MATAPATTVINGRYLVLKELGEGGMGRVFLVEDTHHGGALLALKTILPETANEEFLERFRIEFAQLAKLRHPSIAAYYFLMLVENGKMERAHSFLSSANKAQLLPEEQQLLTAATRKLLQHDSQAVTKTAAADN